MLKVKLIFTLVCALLLCGCGNSLQNAVENIKVTNQYNLIDVLKKSKLIDSYEIKVMDDDPLRGEVAVLIKLKKDATYSDQKLLKSEKSAYLVILAQFYLSQTMHKYEWSLGRYFIQGQLSTGDKALSEHFFLHPSIFDDLANNKSINLDKMEDAKNYY